MSSGGDEDDRHDDDPDAAGSATPGAPGRIATAWRTAVRAVVLATSLGEHFKQAYEGGSSPEVIAANERATRNRFAVFVGWCAVVGVLELRRTL